MKTQKVREGAALIRNETAKIVTKSLPVFYNPLMKHNRDMSLLLLAGEGRKLQCCDLLAGSGVRAIRMLKEIPDVIGHVTINDVDAKTYDRIKKNLQLNDLEGDEWTLQDFAKHSVKTDGNRENEPYPMIIASSIDGGQLLLSSNGYDYIDVDPFGSPNPFLDAACKRIARNGILALTFTDTSALAGSYPDACERKYWGTPTDGARMHEVGLRLAVRKAQLVGAQYDKALTPILVYNKDHYYRAYFRAEKGKKKCDALLARHGRWDDEPAAGPLWLGRLSDPKIIGRMKETLASWTGPTEDAAVQEIKNWLSTIAAENSFEQPGHYYFLNYLQQDLGFPVKKEQLLKLLGKDASTVHYENNAIKTTRTVTEIKKLLH